MTRNALLALSCALALSVSAHAQNDSRLESVITGNQEQPQVLYLVPWQTPDSPTLKYDVINRQAATVYEHLERSELRRELKHLPPLAAPTQASAPKAVGGNNTQQSSSSQPASQSAAAN
jgi:hypothetical protein